MFYFDNAATTLHKPQEVVDAVVQAMTSFGNYGRGVHEGALSAARTVSEARQALAGFFGCPDPSRVIFTANATASLNMAICGMLSEGDGVIATDYAHNSVLRPLYRLEKERGIELQFVPADMNGNLDYNSFERFLTPKTRAVVSTHASNLTGDVTDLAKVGAFCRKHGLLHIVDAAQTAGTFPIDMDTMGIDALCFSGHKGMMGPQGIGVLILMPGIEVRPLLVGGTGVQSHLPTQPTQYPEHLEAGTLNTHGIAGLLAALRYTESKTSQAIHAHELALATRFYEGVRGIDGVMIYGDHSSDRAPIVTLNIRDYGSSEVADALARDYDIAVRSGAHCAPRMHAALGTEKQGAVRFSFGWFNTEEEVDAAIRAVKEIAE